MVDKAVKPAPQVSQVESLVGAALGLDTTRGDAIVVDTIAFEKESTEAAAAAAKGAASGANPMMDYATTGVGILILGAVVFVLLRGMRKTKIELIDIPSPQLALAGANSGTSTLALTTQSGGNAALVPAAVASTQEQVLSLVDQQPDEVAVLLRSWLGDRS
jgi:flagellar M-ring protein FliF